ncbi:MAG: hypothetical protein GY745_04145 [Actinomycetia bacterium]|nr:hypothetical protein [Actinomycetes bacterium]MCP4084232.1 hypothetical protein [Actinomycetes bacterium]
MAERSKPSGGRSGSGGKSGPRRSGTGGKRSGSGGSGSRSGPKPGGSRSSGGGSGNSRGRSGDSRRSSSEPADRYEFDVDRRDWGGVARRGAGRVKEGWTDEGHEKQPYEEKPRQDSGEEIWIDEGPVRKRASDAVKRGRRRPVELKAPPEAHGELVEATGKVRGKRLHTRLGEAATAFANERYPEARRILKPLADEAPSVAAVRELHGLTLYRLGRWAAAIKELDAFYELTGSTEQYPVLADCHRALRHWGEVERLWAELGEASPGAELTTEGRIVSAGALADQGKLSEAITRLGKGYRFPKRPGEHHLRRAYALADLHERAGDVARARQLFAQVLAADSSFADTAERIDALG